LGLEGWDITQAGLSPLAAVCWSGGVLQNIKLQAPNLSVLGVGCQVSGVPPEADQVSGVRKKKDRS
jgi:hypothetical protein